MDEVVLQVVIYGLFFFMVFFVGMDLDLMLFYIEFILYKLLLCLVVYRNQWYDVRGFGKDVNWEYGFWYMILEEYVLYDGILYLNFKDYCVFLFFFGNFGWI